MATQGADHYFSSQPSTPMKRRPLSVVLAGEKRQLQSAGGIFSPDGVDKGTVILLNEAPPPAAEGNLLDIGCGWGPIALTLALRSPAATVYAVDVNERSLELTQDWTMSAPPRPTLWTLLCVSTPSGPIRPSGLGSQNCTRSYSCGCRGWPSRATPTWWSKRIWVQIPFSAGWPPNWVSSSRMPVSLWSATPPTRPSGY